MKSPAPRLGPGAALWPGTQSFGMERTFCSWTQEQPQHISKAQLHRGFHLETKPVYIQQHPDLPDAEHRTSFSLFQSSETQPVGLGALSVHKERAES